MKKKTHIVLPIYNEANDIENVYIELEAEIKPTSVSYIARIHAETQNRPLYIVDSAQKQSTK